MGKIIQWWFDRGKLTRIGGTWFILLVLVRVVMWYVVNNVGFSDMKTAATVGKVDNGILFLAIALFVLMFIGFFAEKAGAVRQPADQTVKIAEGVWMIKK